MVTAALAGYLKLEPGRLQVGKRRAAVPTSSWLLVLVLGGRRVGLGPIDCVAPPLDVAQLMAKNRLGRSGISAPQTEHW